MTALPRPLPALLALATLLVAAPATAATPGRTSEAPRPDIARYAPGQVQVGGKAAGLSRAAATDTFNIYGGVLPDGTNDRRPEGQFQTPLLIPDAQGWTGEDLTAVQPHWNISSYNAANLDPAPGNRAMWCGVPAGTPAFDTAPGYGNNWNDLLQWQVQVNPFQNSTFRLRFEFNHDTEPGYDFFHVEWDSAGSWKSWASFDGSNRDSLGAFSQEVVFDQTRNFATFMYSGSGGSKFVRFRLRVSSDGAWSDEDGLWNTNGAVQVDNIQVWQNGALVTNYGDGIATFEDLGSSDDTEGWSPELASFAGDFSKVLPTLFDIDPCRRNRTPQFGFVDDGTPPANGDGASTGGTVSNTWSYGVLGGWVVNYNGGLSNGVVALNNEVWSPPIDWDDPTTTVDDGLVGGALLRFTTWTHLPLTNGMFYVWHVRSDDGNGWSAWQDRNFVYYGGTAAWANVEQDVTDLLLSGTQKVQIALGVVDLAGLFAFPGSDATPSPTFDNVSFWRYDLGGPAFSTRNIDLFQDSFPNGGSVDTSGDLSLLSVRLDMARDISTGTANVPGDSIIVDVVPTVPGTQLSGPPEMVWVLETNPKFDGVRSLPAGASLLGTSPRGWELYTGTVAGDSSRTSAGAVVSDRWYFDAPNDGPGTAPHHGSEPAMFFPGDRFRYFLQAMDTGGNTTTLPADTTGFAAGAVGNTKYSRLFTVRALPSLVDDGQGGWEQPEILFVNDFGHRGHEALYLSALGQAGAAEDEHFDTYTVRGPSSLVGNGIGSAGAHGANADQLAGYSCLLYVSGNLSDGLLSDGSNANGNDKGDDLATLAAWHQLPGDRYAAYFGDNLYSFLSGAGASGGSYLQNVLAVDLQDADVRDEIGGQATPKVLPQSPLFGNEYVAYGGCLGINTFDSIRAFNAPGATAAHAFVDGQGAPYVPAASVLYQRTEAVGPSSYTRIDISFPYDLGYIISPNDSPSAPPAQSAASGLMIELLGLFGSHVTGGALDTDNPTLPLELLGNHPNPFNPSTTIRFRLGASGPVELVVYNLRGERVRSLVSGEMAAGPQAVQWNGLDENGASVASGVYLYELRAAGERLDGKMLLLK